MGSRSEKEIFLQKGGQSYDFFSTEPRKAHEIQDEHQKVHCRRNLPRATTLEVSSPLVWVLSLC